MFGSWKKNSRSISRVLYSACAKCLSFISNKCRHLPLAIYPPTSGEQPYCVGIHDLATHKTYGFECYHPNRWALTSPFHPFHTPLPPIGHPLQWRGKMEKVNYGGYFLLRYSALTNSFPLGNMVLCVARTFLHSRGKSDKPTYYFDAKIQIIFYIIFDDFIVLINRCL